MPAVAENMAANISYLLSTIAQVGRRFDALPRVIAIAEAGVS